MSNEKENERIDEAPSSDSDDELPLKYKLDHPVVDVSEYVISFGKAGIQRLQPNGSRTKSIKIIGPTRTVRESLGTGKDFKRLKWYLQMSRDHMRFQFKSLG